MTKKYTESEFIQKLKEAASEQYMKETNNAAPSIKYSIVTRPSYSNSIDIVILRDNENKIVGIYEHIKNFIFQRMDFSK